MRIKVKQTNNRDQQMKFLNQAISKLKKKLDKEGVFKILKSKKHYVKPSEIRHQQMMKMRHEKKKKKYGKKR